MEQLKGRPALIYSRYSSKRQSKGMSTERQLSQALAFIEEKGLKLIEHGIRSDEGVSAFKGTNNKDGELGRLLRDVDEGRIPRDVVLVVENVDRLSRETPVGALRLVQDIVERGITIVTLHDMRAYSAESIQAGDLGSIFVLLGVLSRAHEESKTKSERSKAAWRKKKQQESEGIVTKGRKPFWIRPDGSLNETKRKIVELVFETYLNCTGIKTTATRLNSLGIPTGSGTGIWSIGSVRRLLTDPKTIGLVGSQKLYDAAIDPATFAQATKKREANRGQGKPSDKFSSALKGIVHCGSCGGAMQVIASGHGTRTIRCRKAHVDGCDNSGGFSYRSAVLFLTLCWFENPPTTDTEQNAAKRAELMAKQAAVTKSIERLLELTTDPDFSDMPELRKKLDTERQKRAELEEMLEALTEEDMDNIFEAVTHAHSDTTELTEKAITKMDIESSTKLNLAYRAAKLQATLINRGKQGIECIGLRAERDRKDAVRVCEDDKLLGFITVDEQGQYALGAGFQWQPKYHR